MLEYEITAKRIDAHGSIAHCNNAEIIIDTDLKGRADAFNPAELLLAAVAACILKNIERIAPIIYFEYKTVNIKVHGERQDKPPKMSRIDYEIIVDSDESEHKMNLMHENIRKYGTVYNTVLPGTLLSGKLIKADN